MTEQPSASPAPPQQQDWRAPGDTTSLTLYPDGPPAQKDSPRRAEQPDCDNRWQPIETAPTDGTVVWVYVASAEGLPSFQGSCAYHADGGWCADELRPVTHWVPIESVFLAPPSALASTGEQPDCRMEWQSGGTAPRDGTEITILLDYPMPAYWDDELRTFVLSRPLHLESVARPIRWRPSGSAERSNTESSPETTAPSISAADLDAEIKHALREGERYGAKLRRATGHDTLLDRALYPAEDPPSPPAVVDYTGWAQIPRPKAVSEWDRRGGPKASDLAELHDSLIAAAFSAIASDHQAEIARHLEHLSAAHLETAEALAKLARLREPEMRLAIVVAMIAEGKKWHLYLAGNEAADLWSAALAVITKELT